MNPECPAIPGDFPVTDASFSASVEYLPLGKIERLAAIRETPPCGPLLLPMSDAADNRRIGPFQLEGKLGVGGMGIVYKATYLKGGQKVAVKVLAPDLTADPKVAKRFEREMDILKRLKHPHIVKYYGGSTTGQQRFYAMELLTGGSLDDVLKKKGRLGWEETVDYGIQIAKALEHAHNANVIHRDLKPGNLLLSADGTLKLSDFGIARDNEGTALTAAGKTLGTMAYMAPEQITGKLPISRRTDLYALGCVLFQMLTGRTPFESETQPVMLFKHIEETPPSVREFNLDCPVWLDKVILTLMEKDPADRPFDALAVQVMLEEVKQKVAEQESIAKATLAGGGGAMTIVGDDRQLAKALGKKKKKKKSREFVPWYERSWFLGLCLVGLIGLTVWLMWPESEAAMYARIKSSLDAVPVEDRPEYSEEIDTFLTRFPSSQHATEARSWMDDIAVTRAERRMSALELRPNATPSNDGERMYLDARRYERENDRYSALSRYEAMRVLLQDKPELKAYVTLAGRRITTINQSLGTDADPVHRLRREIVTADKLYQEGQTLKARERWKALLEFHRGKPEFEVLVDFIQARLDDPATAMRESPVTID